MYLTNRVGILLSSKLLFCNNQKMDSSFALPGRITAVVCVGCFTLSVYFVIFGSLGESPVIADQHVPY